MPGSTHAGTLVTTPLTHGGSFALGVALGVAHGVSLTHGVSSAHEGTLITTLGVTLAHGVSLGVSSKHGGAFAHALTFPVCVRRSTHFNTLVNTHRDTTHTGTTLATTHTGTLTLGTTLTLGILIIHMV